ncbi:uncharacterized protein BDV14DRAFT_164368 [Aspergillus stella-maris]|uniref:uncharacterized protein n=1 Tax=Aspergillus stella-maris TaxID=1810926 RepID=UPI003CCCD715
MSLNSNLQNPAYVVSLFVYLLLIMSSSPCGKKPTMQSGWVANSQPFNSPAKFSDRAFFLPGPPIAHPLLWRNATF